jgi:predicted metal-dependent peptidase
MFNLNDHIFRLLQQEPFFAALSRRIEKTSSKAVPTAGVRVNPDTGYFEMVYNPEFFEGLTDDQRSGVLIHEFYHLVFEHVTGRLPDELAGVMASKKPTRQEQALFKLWNIAADLSINWHIGKSKLPENCCFPGEGMFADLPGDQTAEWYFDKLKEMAEDSGDGGGGSDGEPGQPGEGQPQPFDPDQAGQFDDHDAWGGEAADAATQEIAKERLKEALRDAAEEATTRSWGSVSATVRREIAERLQSRVDWRKVLRWFVKCSQRSNKRSTPRRLNKRYAYIHPGQRIERVANIAVSIDQSGSVSDEMLASFYGELNKLAEVATFTVIPFDTRVAEDKVYVWKKGEKRKRQRVMYGGTCFNAPTAFVNKGKYDGHIVLTDMCAPKPKRSTCPRMWMTDKHNGNNPYFKTNERVVIVD